MIALGDCAIAVSNANESARWWNEKLGFAIHTVGNGKHAVMVAPPGDRFVLHLCEGFESVQAGNSGIAFVTDDLEGLVSRMEAGGVVFPEPLRKGAGLGMAKFADPDGNVFWLLGAPTTFIRAETRLRARVSKPRARPAVKRPRSTARRPRSR